MIYLLHHVCCEMCFRTDPSARYSLVKNPVEQTCRQVFVPELTAVYNWVVARRINRDGTFHESIPHWWRYGAYGVLLSKRRQISDIFCSYVFNVRGGWSW